MPNQCTRCGKMHADDAPYLLKGCNECGAKFFFYVKSSVLKKAEKELKKLSKKEVKEIERDVRDIIPEYAKTDDTVILDLEAIRVIKPGKYRIDVPKLFSQKPLVLRIGPGKYELDLSTLITKWRKMKLKE